MDCKYRAMDTNWTAMIRPNPIRVNLELLHCIYSMIFDGECQYKSGLITAHNENHNIYIYI